MELSTLVLAVYKNEFQLEGGKEEIANHDNSRDFLLPPSVQNFMHPLLMVTGFDLPSWLGMPLMPKPRLRLCLQEAQVMFLHRWMFKGPANIHGVFPACQALF